jgi:DNA-binding winged helix-turn-helix (wHTH) protein
MLPDTAINNYLTDKTIIFSPSELLLQHCETMKTKKIRATEAKCLMLLLNKHGSVVSQYELLEFAWGETHREVSFNLFYQCILSLRKSFAQLEYPGTIITTMPRKGLIIDINLPVETVGKNFTDEKYKAATPMIPVSSKHIRHNIVCLPDIIILVFTAITIGLIGFGPNYDRNYFSGYVLAGELKNKCKYFFNSDGGDFFSHKLFVSQNTAICKANKFLYVSAYDNVKSISAIVCSAPINQSINNTCNSFFYQEYKW